jgi:hypothetical protein
MLLPTLSLHNITTYLMLGCNGCTLPAEPLPPQTNPFPLDDDYDEFAEPKEAFLADAECEMVEEAMWDNDRS